MTTHYMPPSSFMSGPPAGGYMGYPGKNGGFSFRKRVERVDWRRIASVDVDTIARTLDFTTLQDNIMNITFCNLESELDIRSIDPNFVKLFKLAQLTIEYLLHSQEYLASLCASMEEKSKQSDQETEKVKAELETLQKEVAEVKKESHKRKKLLIAQQQLMYAGNESYNKCPFCTKAFLNNSYLQSHIIRRHSAGTNNNKDGSSSLSPDLGVGSDSGQGQGNNLDAEVSKIKERLLQQEAELKEEKRALLSLKNKDPRISVEMRQKATDQDHELNEEEGEAGGVVANLMKEIREMNAKFQASQQALMELEARTGSKRSHLGLELEDDIENEKELLREQRSDVASHKEMIQMKIDQMQQVMESKLEKQDRKWQKRLHQMTQQHASEMKRLNNALESTSKSMEGSHSPRAIKQRQDVEELLKDALQRHLQNISGDETREQEKALEKQEKKLEREIAHRSEARSRKAGRTSHSGSRDPTPRQQAQQQQMQQQQQQQQAMEIKHSSMYPSDDEETADFGTGTSSLRTPIGSMRASTMGQTGTQSLHASQFLEELRKNPTLGVMRQELAALLQEHIEKKGIPPGQKGISDHVLQSKLSMLHTQRQANVQKYPNFQELREQFNRRATKEARERYKQLSISPRGQPPAELSPKSSHHHVRASSSAATPRAGPPHPQQHIHNGQRGPAVQPEKGKQLQATASSGTRKGPSPRAQPRSTTPQGRKTPMSTGTTTEWTSTQFDTDDDEEESEEENSASHGGKAFVPSPGARLIQSGPARGPSPSPRTQASSQGPKPRLIQSKPLTSKGDEDAELDDLLESEGEERQPASPQRGGVSSLRNTIESQLGARTPGAKPFGGYDTVGSVGAAKAKKVTDSEEESEWDDTEPAGKTPATVKRTAGQGRASTDVASSNTYGTSAWGGSSSRAASTVRGDNNAQRDLRDRRSTSRSSFASVTSVSSDDEMNLDNI
ncbi:Zinc finger protein dzip1 [Plakobranchus ocellatus]|uniref:Zinc finger protein dzip1 n=1 Tax=Plakobranchus ocellatus TaxID=259542 RepID=A0AAV4C6I0_9GAST|nr:Zinc finger protein dzip1 [Plakobranchus ocellatus]